MLPLETPARGLSQAARDHARRVAAQAPPLLPGTVERVRQIIYRAAPLTPQHQSEPPGLLPTKDTR
jgi:hypothetical protein